MADAQIFGLKPTGHHLTSIIIHIINVLLLFVVFRYMTGAIWQSAFVAALFALHPVNVESVAYVSSRKELLCGFFWILGLAAYTSYSRKPAPGKYALVALALLLGTMANPIIMAFPLVCFLLDFWPLDRFKSTSWRNLVAEKLPLLGIAFACGILALYTQQQAEAVQTIEMLPLSVRFTNAVWAYVAYIRNMIYPTGLAIFYPYPTAFAAGKTIAAITILLTVTWTAIRFCRQLPFLLTGWFWFILALAPAIGIVKAGGHAMADRYAYISFIGLFIMIAWGGAKLTAKLSIKRGIVAALAIVALVIFGATATRQLNYWQNSITIFQHTLSVTSNNAITHNNLGKVLAKQGNIETSRIHFKKALAIAPDFPMAHNNLGVLLESEGQTQEAIDHFNKALELKPDLITIRYNLGHTLLIKDEPGKAAIHFHKILETDPGHLKAATRLAWIYNAKKQHEKATLSRTTITD